MKQASKYNWTEGTGSIAQHKGEYTSELTILTYNHTLKKKEKKKNLGKKSFKAPNKLNTKYPDLANAYGYIQ